MKNSFLSKRGIENQLKPYQQCARKDYEAPVFLQMPPAVFCFVPVDQSETVDAAHVRTTFLHPQD